MAEAAELVFIPLPVMGHLPSTIETARNLVARSDDARQISVTILIMKFPSLDNTIDSFIQSLKPDSTGRLNILELPELENPPDITSNYFLRHHMEAYKPVIRQALLQKASRYHSRGTQQQAPPRGCRKLAGLVLDMCCTTIIDVAKELGSPSYIFYAPSALCLCLTLQLAYHGVPDITVDPSTGQSSSLINDESTAAVPEPGPVVEVAGLRNPLPAKLCPDVFLDKHSGWGQTLLECATRFKETKGILLNTFAELEYDLINSLISTPRHGHEQDKIVSNIVPAVYPIGPMVNLNKDLATNKIDKHNQIISWLDSQPLSSVVFLCFGSSGAFQENQVKEIAAGLEQSGQRFLWSLRRTPSSSTISSSGMRPPEEFDDFKDVLPKGFLARTAGVGKVIGWAPQASVLAHKAVGAFVSHCGWNSVLESLLFGVPLVAWPMYAEQQVNAFELVVELGLAAEIRMDYKCSFQREANVFVGADVIERAIRKVMEEGELREKTKHISQIAKKSLEAGGSSYKSMGYFIEDVFKNLS